MYYLSVYQVTHKNIQLPQASGFHKWNRYETVWYSTHLLDNSKEKYHWWHWKHWFSRHNTIPTNDTIICSEPTSKPYWHRTMLWCAWLYKINVQNGVVQGQVKFRLWCMWGPSHLNQNINIITSLLAHHILMDFNDNEYESVNHHKEQGTQWPSIMSIMHATKVTPSSVQTTTISEYQGDAHCTLELTSALIPLQTSSGPRNLEIVINPSHMLIDKPT